MKTQDWIALSFGIAGMALVWWQAGWLAAVGVALMIWGNNINRPAPPQEPPR